MADELAAQHAVAVYDVGFWKTERAVEGIAGLLYVAHGHHFAGMVLDEAVIGGVVVINAYGEHNHVAILESVLHGNQGRRFRDARRAPASPKIQYDNLAAELTEGHFAILILDGKIRRNGANSGRRRSAGAAGYE